MEGGVCEVVREVCLENCSIFLKRKVFISWWQ